MICHASAPLYDLERTLDPTERDQKSVTGSSCIGASVVGRVYKKFGRALVQRGPAYTELALFGRLDSDGTLRLVNNLGLHLGDEPERFSAAWRKETLRPRTWIPGQAWRPSAITPNARAMWTGKRRAASTRVRAGCTRHPGCAGRLAVVAVRLDSIARPGDRPHVCRPQHSRRACHLPPAAAGGTGPAVGRERIHSPRSL